MVSHYDPHINNCKASNFDVCVFFYSKVNVPKHLVCEPCGPTVAGGYDPNANQVWYTPRHRSWHLPLTIIMHAILTLIAT